VGRGGVARTGRIAVDGPSGETGECAGRVGGCVGGRLGGQVDSGRAVGRQTAVVRMGGHGLGRDGVGQVQVGGLRAGRSPVGGATERVYFVPRTTRLDPCSTA
jgi:hypothetical protein